MSEQAPSAAITRQATAEGLECPACRAAEEALASLVERIRRGEARNIDWLDVCATHAWLLTRWSDLAKPLVTARLRAASERLGQASVAPPGGGWLGKRRQAVSFAGDGPCPFCEVMEAAARDALEPLAAASDGTEEFCMPHLCTALDMAKGREQVRRIARAARRSYTGLEHDLSELIRKSDYRFRGEPRGREATSWTRAARLMAGAPGVRWSARKDPRIES